MEFAVSALLSSFSDDKLVAPKALEKKLECDTAESLQHLEIALNALERSGLLVKERGKYRRVIEEGVVEGKLRCSSKGFCFAIQEGEETEDIYIRESQLNSAWNGDRVLVKVTKEGRRRRSPEGQVRLILERSNPSVLAHVRKTEEGQYRAAPLDDRLLFELQLVESEAGPRLEDAVDHLVHVEVLRYPLGQMLPLGRLNQILGSDAQSAADTELVFCKYDLPRGFSETVEAEAQELPVKLKKTDQKGRLALQKLLTVTLHDPELGLTGLDKAFSLEPQDSGGWTLGIHIADIAAFIPAGSALDQEAKRRATAIGLDNTLVPLFPEAVAARVGTFSPKKERLAISLLVHLDPSGAVVDYEVQPSVVQVDHQLSFEQLMGCLNVDKTEGKPKAAIAKLSPIFDWLSQLNEVTQLLRKQRHDRGDFDLTLPHLPPAIFGDDGRLGVICDGMTPTGRHLVAELLTLANHLLTSHLQGIGVPVMFQIQAAPEVAKLQDLMRLIENLEVTFSLTREGTILPQDFQLLAEKLSTLESVSILFELLAETLESAQYSVQSGPHFGLAYVQDYGQFVSPLNRYGDLFNQRILQAVFQEGRDRKTSRAKEKVNLRHSACVGQINWNVLPPDTQRELETEIGPLVSWLNERVKVVRQAEQDFLGLKKTKTMQQRTGEIYQGIITGIQSYGFFVRLEALLVEGLVHVSSLKDDWYEYRARQQTLIGRKNRRQYRLGDRVEVEIKSVDYYRQQIDLAVVGGGSEATDEDIQGDDWNEDDAEGFDDQENAEQE